MLFIIWMSLSLWATTPPSPGITRYISKNTKIHVILISEMCLLLLSFPQSSLLLFIVVTRHWSSKPTTILSVYSPYTEKWKITNMSWDTHTYEHTRHRFLLTQKNRCFKMKLSVDLPVSFFIGYNSTVVCSILRYYGSMLQCLCYCIEKEPNIFILNILPKLLTIIK